MNERGGRKLRKERMEQLERENKDLRDALGMTEPQSLDTWGTVLTQNMRDAMAARALIQEWGHPLNALRRLGFEIAASQSGRLADKEQMVALIKQVFDTDGVRDILSRTLEDIEGSKPQILARLNQTALYGDDDASVRAASQIAKIAGWNKPDPENTVPIINLYTLINGQAQPVTTTQKPALAKAQTYESDFLAHEPGQPVRIDSGDDVVSAAIESVQSYE